VPALHSRRLADLVASLALGTTVHQGVRLSPSLDVLNDTFYHIAALGADNVVRVTNAGCARLDIPAACLGICAGVREAAGVPRWRASSRTAQREHNDHQNQRPLPHSRHRKQLMLTA
jgi:hypothetical protein